MNQITPTTPESGFDAATQGGKSDKLHDNLPMNAGMVPLYLFLASLTMLFLALMFGYVFIRTRVGTPAFGELKLPLALWASTIMLIVSSVTAHLAVKYVKQNKLVQFRQMLVLTMLCAIGFMLVQFPCLYNLLMQHEKIIESEARYYFYGLIFFMIVVHALHVIGGIIPMSVVTFKAHKGKYHAQDYGPVQYTAVYWHFLDIVWLVMFLTMLAIG